MATEIRVSKENVVDLLKSGRERPFVIPEYQRPYAWSEDEIQVLFDDLWDFTTGEVDNTNGENTYFLGSIVSFESKDEESEKVQEIIDGQQRITSLFLLLRAIYTMLSNAEVKTDEAKHFINIIEPALWKTNKMTGAVNYQSVLLTSKVMNNEGNNILRRILETGNADSNAKDNYSKNYIKFQLLLKEKAAENPMMIFEFIYVVLNQAILLPITADTQDTALTIFSTLNDRGLPLSDADIFKAKMYSKLNADSRMEFIENWKDLDETATAASETIQQLFYYYMFHLRALEADKNTTTPGVRKYYSAEKFHRLYREDLLSDLMDSLNLWRVVNKGESNEEEEWSKNLEIRKALDVLKSYPNEFWKYPVLIYYLVHRKNEHFEKEFKLFLYKLIVELLERFLIAPTVAAVKSEIMKLNAAIINSARPVFEFREPEREDIKRMYKVPHPRIVRMMLKIIAYAHKEQDDLLQDGWEIEHIFPQKWQPSYFPQEHDSVVREKVDYFGNKTLLEKKLNIVASNGYFAKKQEQYAKSKYALTKELAQHKGVDWSLDDIAERNIRLSDTLEKTLGKWRQAYAETQRPVDAQIQPSEEQLKQIEEFRKKGWV